MRNTTGAALFGAMLAMPVAAVAEVPPSAAIQDVSVQSAATYYWVNTVTNKVVSGTMPPNGVTLYLTRAAATVMLTYYWLSDSGEVMSGHKADVPLGKRTYWDAATAASYRTVYWVDPKTNLVKKGYLRSKPLTVSQYYLTPEEADANIPVWWVDKGTKTVMQGVKGSAPFASEMIYKSAAAAQEYLTMGGHTTINLSQVMRLGATGAGVKVAVVDTGVDASHVELRKRMDNRSGWDYVANRLPSTGSSADPNGHGTHVGGIIAGTRDSKDFFGVAPESTLVNFRILPASGSGPIYDNWLVDIVNRGEKAGVKIYNHSWGDSRGIAEVSPAMLATPSVTRYQQAVASGSVFVWAAGNEGKANPHWRAAMPYAVNGLQKGWLAVAALDPASGLIADYSNRCGLAADWCLTAPGSNITSAKTGGGTIVKSGTSMAAPYVSGAIALLKSYFTTLSEQDVAARLLVSANKGGAYADKSIYGQGLMDVGAASQPIGGLYLATGATTTGSVASVGALAVNADIAAASALKGKLADTKVVLVDGFQRATFVVSAGEIGRLTSAKDRPTMNVATQTARMANVGKASAAEPRFGVSADYFGVLGGLAGNPTAALDSGPAQNLSFNANAVVPSMRVSLVTAESKFAMTSDLPVALLDDTALAGRGLGMAQMMRGEDPMNEALTSGFALTQTVAKNAKVMALTARARDGSANQYRVGVEQKLGDYVLGFETGNLVAYAGYDAVLGNKEHAIENASKDMRAYAKVAPMDGLQLMASVSHQTKTSGQALGALRASGESQFNTLSLAAQLDLGPKHALGVVWRADLTPETSYQMRLPTAVDAAGRLSYTTVKAAQSGETTQAFGLFYAGEVGKDAKLLFNVAHDDFTDKAWLGYSKAW